MHMDIRTRKEIKKTGRHNMRRNYINCVIISLIAVFFIGTGLSISDNITTNTRILTDIAEEFDLDLLSNTITKIEDVQQKIVDATSIGEKSNHGAISEIYRQSHKSGSFSQALASGISTTILGGKINNHITSIIGILIGLFFFIFVHGLLRIGVSRFYMENRLYEDTHINNILFVLRMKKIRHAAGIVALKTLYLVLWSLTIVGLPIKLYSYSLVSYIVAENPTIKTSDAIKLSTEMMKGHKWRLFKYDISFIPWFILSVFTFGILQYLFITPYYSSAKAEYYMEIRKLAKEKELQGTEYLIDIYLETMPAKELLAEDQDEKEYPIELFPPEAMDKRSWLKYDYNIKYSIVNLILLFFVFAFIGWLYETILESIKHGMFINRGTLYGPWVPIYGVGGIAVLILLRKFFNKPIAVFILSFIVCGIIEYTGALMVEHFTGASYWDYSGYFFNIQGRICLEGLLVFSIGSCAVIYSLAPVLSNVLDKIPLPIRKVIIVILIAAFGADCVAAKLYPRSGYGLTYGGQ